MSGGPPDRPPCVDRSQRLRCRRHASRRAAHPRYASRRRLPAALRFPPATRGGTGGGRPAHRHARGRAARSLRRCARDRSGRGRHDLRARPPGVRGPRVRRSRPVLETGPSLREAARLPEPGPTESVVRVYQKWSDPATGATDPVFLGEVTRPGYVEMTSSSLAIVSSPSRSLRNTETTRTARAQPTNLETPGPPMFWAGCAGPSRHVGRPTASGRPPHARLQLVRKRRQVALSRRAVPGPP